MTAPATFETNKTHVAAYLLARGETLLSFNEQTGVFAFPASAASVAKRLERPKKNNLEARRYFVRSYGRLKHR